MRGRGAVGILILAAVACFGGKATAAHCGACNYPAGPTCMEQCSVPEVRYHVCYRTGLEPQTRICYRPVYQTVMRECSFTVCRPVFEQHVRECRVTCYRQEWEEFNVRRCYTTCRPVYEQNVRQVNNCTYRPVCEAYQ